MSSAEGGLVIGESVAWPETSQSISQRPIQHSASYLVKNLLNDILCVPPGSYGKVSLVLETVLIAITRTTIQVDIPLLRV